MSKEATVALYLLRLRKFCIYFYTISSTIKDNIYERYDE